MWYCDITSPLIMLHHFRIHLMLYISRVTVYALVCYALLLHVVLSNAMPLQEWKNVKPTFKSLSTHCPTLSPTRMSHARISLGIV